jgi:hypothetical protein
VAVLVLAAPALALTVHVRVEGVRTNLFGATEPSLTVFEGEVVASDDSVHMLTGPTALGALEAASRRAELYYRLRAASFGLYVDQIGRHPAGGTSGWVYKVNGAVPPVGAAAYVLEEGDRVLWYHATFGASGGPSTLDLRPVAGGCYRASAFDDAGTASRVRNVVFRVDARAVRDRDGVFCPGAPWERLQVTRAGMVPSNVVER